MRSGMKREVKKSYSWKSKIVKDTLSSRQIFFGCPPKNWGVDGSMSELMDSHSCWCGWMWRCSVCTVYVCVCVCVWGGGCWHSLLLHLADDVGRDGRVEVDGVVSKPLRAFVAFTTPALEGLPNADLSAVAVLGVVLDTIHILKQEDQCLG